MDFHRVLLLAWLATRCCLVTLCGLATCTAWAIDPTPAVDPAPPAVLTPSSKLDLKKLPGIVIDNDQAETTGEWTKGTHVNPFVGSNYMHDSNKDKGEKTATFRPEIPATGNYIVRLSYTVGSTRAANVPITLQIGEQTVVLYLDERSYAKEELAPFTELGVFSLPHGKNTSITIATTKTVGHVIVDALWLEPTKDAATLPEKLATQPLTDEQIAATAPQMKPAKPKDPKIAKNNPISADKKPADSEKSTPEKTGPAAQPFVWLNKPAPKLKQLNADQLDALIEGQLAGMTLSENIPDEQYLRRIALDLCGRPPTEQEFLEFQKDLDSDKRARAVDRYLTHADFGKNWANYWSDTIAARVQPPELTFLTYKPFKEWLAKELNSGKSFAAIVQQLITAQGMIKDNPATTYVGYHQGNPILLAGETARIFLGTQLSCAQCHDHPFEHWKQVEFHQLAAFFVRTSVKMPQNSSLECNITSKDQGEHAMPDKKGTAHPVVLTGEELATKLSDSERRQALAAWLTHAENPFFAKTYVNRIWSRLLGHGFGEPVDNLGEMTEIHFPEAHAALSEHFAATGHDIKDLFRVIMASEAYQRQLPQSPEARKKLFASARTAKLRGDEVFDSLAAATGMPDVTPPQRKATGTERFPPPPKSTRDRVNEVFGFDPSLAPADVSRTMPQALFLMNNEELRKQINAKPDSGTLLAKLLQEQPDDAKAVTTLYHRVLAREPSEAELEVILKHLKSAPNRETGFEDLLWSLINGTEFTTKR